MRQLTLNSCSHFFFLGFLIFCTRPTAQSFVVRSLGCRWHSDALPRPRKQQSAECSRKRTLTAALAVDDISKIDEKISARLDALRKSRIDADYHKHVPISDDNFKENIIDVAVEIERFSRTLDRNLLKQSGLVKQKNINFSKRPANTNRSLTRR